MWRLRAKPAGLDRASHSPSDALLIELPAQAISISVIYRLCALELLQEAFSKRQVVARPGEPLNDCALTGDMSLSLSHMSLGDCQMLRGHRAIHQ